MIFLFIPIKSIFNKDEKNYIYFISYFLYSLNHSVITNYNVIRYVILNEMELS